MPPFLSASGNLKGLVWFFCLSILFVILVRALPSTMIPGLVRHKLSRMSQMSRFLCFYYTLQTPSPLRNTLPPGLIICIAPSRLCVLMSRFPCHLSSIILSLLVWGIYGFSCKPRSFLGEWHHCIPLLIVSSVRFSKLGPVEGHPEVCKSFSFSPNLHTSRSRFRSLAFLSALGLRPRTALFIDASARSPSQWRLANALALEFGLGYLTILSLFWWNLPPSSDSHWTTHRPYNALNKCVY